MAAQWRSGWKQADEGCRRDLCFTAQDEIIRRFGLEHGELLGRDNVPMSPSGLPVLKNCAGAAATAAGQRVRHKKSATHAIRGVRRKIRSGSFVMVFISPGES